MREIITEEDYKARKKERRKKLEALKRYLVQNHLLRAMKTPRCELHEAMSMLYSEYYPSNKILWFIGDYLIKHNSLPDPIEFMHYKRLQNATNKEA